MGWYADTKWDIEFRDEADIIPCYQEVWEAYDGGTPRWTIRGNVDITLLGGVFNEEFDLALTGRRLFGTGYGKAYNYGPDSDEGFSTGKGLYSILAKYVTGTMDWQSEDGDYWRIRFFGDGRWADYAGKIVYPADEARREVKI